MNIFNNQEIEQIKKLSEKSGIGIAFSNEIAHAYLDKGYACILVSDRNDATYAADALVYDEKDLTKDYIEHVYNRHYKIPCKILETERTYLRETYVDDLDALYDLYGHDEIMEFIPPLFERKEEEQYHRDYYDKIYSFYDYGMWGVFDKNTDQMIGRCGIDPHEYGAELGYIISPEYQGRGIAFEVCSAIIRYAKEIELPELWAKIDERNKASVNLAKKLGFINFEEDIYRLEL